MVTDEYVCLISEAKKGKFIPYKVIDVIESSPNSESYILLLPANNSSIGESDAAIYHKKPLCEVVDLNRALDLISDYAYALEEEAKDLWTLIRICKAELRENRTAFTEEIF